MVAFVLAKLQKGYRGFYNRLPLWYHNGDACCYMIGTSTKYLKMGSEFFLSLTKQIEGIFPSICTTCEIRFGAIC